MSKYLIRPHHMLCMQFFEGKGYSDGFVASMAAIKEKLEKEDPQVRLLKNQMMYVRIAHIIWVGHVRMKIL